MKSLVNRIKIFRDYILKKIEVSSLPEEYIVETSAVCDLRCPMCPYKTLDRATGKGMMERSTFEAIIPKIKKYAGLVLLNGWGEVLLNPHIVDFVKICKAEGLRVGFSTNCTHLTEDISRKLIESGLDYVIFPLEGTNKTAYEEIRVGADFESTIANINAFLSLKKQLHSKVFVSVQSLASDVISNRHAAFKKYKEEICKLFPENHKYINDFRLKPLIDLEYQSVKRVDSKPCLFLWRNIFVDFKGNVFSCCIDYNGHYIIGDLIKENLADIWNSKKMQYLRKMNLNPKTMNELATCGHCDVKDEYSSILALLASTVAGAFLSQKFLSLYEKLLMR